MGILSWLGGKKAPAPETASKETGSGSGQGPEDSIKELAAGLDARDGGLRVDAARELLDRWQAGDGAAAEVLAPRIGGLLEDAEPLVRLTGLQAVRTLRKPENLTACESAVLALLADGAAQLRTAAIWAAARIPSETARAQVRVLCQSADEATRFTAARALSEKQDPAALPELCAALRDEHRRQEALSALMALGDAKALPAIASLFEEEQLSEFDRTTCAAALARFGDARGKEHLVARIQADGDDRPIAAEWAGRLGVILATVQLEEVAETEGDPARGAALRAPGAEERLLAMLGSAEEDDLRLDAAEGLAEFGSAPALQALRDAAASGGELGGLCRELLAEVALNQAVEKAAGAAAESADAEAESAAAEAPSAEAASRDASSAGPPEAKS